MQEIKLEAEKRDGAGKGVARKTRHGGYVPGVLYGPDVDSFSLSVKLAELETFLRRHAGANMLIDLDVKGVPGEHKVLIRDLQRDPILGTPLHIDLYQVSMKKKINLSINVILTGTPEGVKLGGVLQHIVRKLEIACLPSDIPDNVEVDVSSLDIGDSIHVSGISIDKVEILTNPSRTMVTVVPPTIIKSAEPTEEEIAEAEAAAEGEAPAEGEAKPEGEGEGKSEGKGESEKKEKKEKKEEGGKKK